MVGLCLLASAVSLGAVVARADEAEPKQIGSQAKGEPGVDRAIDEVRRQMQQTTDLRDDATDSATTVANKGIPSLFSVIVRLAYALIIVVGFLAAGLYFLRRFFSTRLPGSSRYMQVISRMALSQRSSLHLVRVLNRRLLIGEGPEGVRLIAEIPESDEAIAVKGDEPTSRPMKRAEFRDHLEREAKAVQQETFPDRLQGAVRLCREYIGRFRRGSGDA